jgi:serine/threonine protein kinase
MVNLLLDKYEIVRVIGKGGMGMVYEAREVNSGRPVAIKWMHGQSFTDDDPNLLRFQQEARIAGALDSPHVTAVYECAREPEKNVVFQVMELLEGEDLRVLIDRVGALDPDVALRIATQACAGLSAAHTAGVVHRDIKPENIFLSRRGSSEIVVKLLDFGIAKIRGCLPGFASQCGFVRPGRVRFCGVAAPRTRPLRGLKQRGPAANAAKSNHSLGCLDQQRNPDGHPLRDAALR